MAFVIDKQTIDDLSIFGKRGINSIYALFNHTCTRGGSEYLEKMFRTPLDRIDKIDQRIQILSYFIGNKELLDTPFKTDLFDIIEQYLTNQDIRSKLSREQNTMDLKVKNYFGVESSFKTIQKAVSSLLEVLGDFKELTEELMLEVNDGAFHNELLEINELFKNEDIIEAILLKEKKKLAFEELTNLDEILRFKQVNQVEKILQHIFRFDVYIAVSKVAKEHQFVFPKAVPDLRNILNLKGVFHPLIKGAISNSINLNQDQQIVFLTGANMAGKSTFMKSLGIAVYLAHMGFPVPAQSMEFSVKEGMFTTINLPDNLGMGYSHFYAEVLRVKKVAEELKVGKRLFVMFDEMFRGTNVKDAFDATVSLTEAFDKRRNSMFIISTHISEAGEHLAKSCSGIQYCYMPTVMEGSIPKYTYKLTSGISVDRHGMLIIKNEKIVEIIRNRN